MIDLVTRVLLLTGLVVTAVIGIFVHKRTRRPSRRASIVAMYPALVVWIVFELDVIITAPLTEGALRWGIWLSRVGVIALIFQDCYQLWAIHVAERGEQDALT